MNRNALAVSRGEEAFTSAGHCIGQYGIGCSVGISVRWNFIRFRWKIGAIFYHRFSNIRHIDAATRLC